MPLCASAMLLAQLGTQKMCLLLVFIHRLVACAPMALQPAPMAHLRLPSRALRPPGNGPFKTVQTALPPPPRCRASPLFVLAATTAAVSAPGGPEHPKTGYQIPKTHKLDFFKPTD